jgi:hypothetical protein
MFSLEQQNAKLIDIKPRVKRHGEDIYLAADLRFEMKASNDILSVFDPSLKTALYKESDGVQGLLIDEPGYLPSLKFPMLGLVKWAKEFAGYTLSIYCGFGLHYIRLLGCKIDGFLFNCQDGGIVMVKFRVTAHPEQNEMGRLCALIQREVEISLTLPADKDLLEVA